ncbi:acylneuraminate cytidylyltransferase family protein [Pseudomonadales bacterium]|nr:acylneuraminate cytidylyltransferase family protein [Pseudomonadales bacterium]
MKILAVIPARGGSKGIPNKNLVSLCGRPLIDFSIRKALDSNCFCDVLVTSDSNEILSVARSIDDRVIALQRPLDLATDEASSLDVVKHAVGSYSDLKGEIPDAIFLLQPTSPIRSLGELNEACEFFKKSSKKSLIGVSVPIQHPSDFIYQHDQGFRYCFDRKESFVVRRQDFADCWFINGSIYITETQFLFDQNMFYALDNCELFHMSLESSVDIDTPIDLMIAETVIKHLNYS